MSSFFYPNQGERKISSDEIAGKPSFIPSYASGCASSEQHAKEGIRRISVLMRQATQLVILIKVLHLRPF